MDAEKLKISSTLSGNPPDPGHESSPAPAPLDPRTGMHKDYWVLSEEELAKGFVRPMREEYKHLTCGTVTRMGPRIAATYARDPAFYGATFCVYCRSHFPVGADGEFVWMDGTKVGS